MSNPNLLNKLFNYILDKVLVEGSLGDLCLYIFNKICKSLYFFFEKYNLYLLLFYNLALKLILNIQKNINHV